MPDLQSVICHCGKRMPIVIDNRISLYGRDVVCDKCWQEEGYDNREDPEEWELFTYKTVHVRKIVY